MSTQRLSISDYYSKKFDESSRLKEDFGLLEQERTREIISRHLPRKPSVILDIGGGAGVYAAWLYRKGYEVHLLDPIARHVESARALLGTVDGFWPTSARMGDARRLPYSDCIAEMVLLMGPLYHLQERHERLQALSEAKRVLKPNGVIIVAAISRFASLMAGLESGKLTDSVFSEIIRTDLRSGRHHNPSSNPSYFTDAYFHRPDELRHELDEAGFNNREILGVEGPMWALRDFARRWSNSETRKKIMEFARKTETEPSLLGMSNHLLAVARKAAE